MTAPSRRIGSSLDFASSLFKRGHRNDRSLDADTTAKPIDSPSASKFNSMFKRLRRKSAGPRESLNDDGYMIVTPKDLAENV
ncbi:hypothetical protein FRC17_001827 [Serendipita sp. 399]|nr:hypothetical protein FRC17_001827 [Serendipita sp. 399]